MSCSSFFKIGSRRLPVASPLLVLAVQVIRTAEAYSKPNQTSETELLAKLVYSWKPLTIKDRKSISDVSLSSEYSFGRLLLD